MLFIYYINIYIYMFLYIDIYISYTYIYIYKYIKNISIMYTPPLQATGGRKTTTNHHHRPQEGGKKKESTTSMGGKTMTILRGGGGLATLHHIYMDMGIYRICLDRPLAQGSLLKSCVSWAAVVFFLPTILQWFGAACTAGKAPSFCSSTR